MNWLKELEKWNCKGFIANCKKRKEINRFLFTGKEHNLHQDSSYQYRIHSKNEERLDEVSSFQNLAIEREEMILDVGYFTRVEIINKRFEYIQKLLDFELEIDESCYDGRKKLNTELCLGFWSITKIDWEVLRKKYGLSVNG